MSLSLAGSVDPTLPKGPVTQFATTIHDHRLIAIPIILLFCGLIAAFSQWKFGGGKKTLMGLGFAAFSIYGLSLVPHSPTSCIAAHKDYAHTCPGSDMTWMMVFVFLIPIAIIALGKDSDKE